MTRTLSTAALMLTTAALFAGCASAPSSPYAGTYAGTFTAAKDGGVLGSGRVSAASVGADGSFSGTITLTSVTPNPSTTASGTVSNDGTTSLKYQYSGGENVTLSGKLTLSGNKVTGTLNTSVAGSAAGTVTLDLTRQ